VGGGYEATAIKKKFKRNGKRNRNKTEKKTEKKKQKRKKGKVRIRIGFAYARVRGVGARYPQSSDTR
jgi:hypothetical protein